LAEVRFANLDGEVFLSLEIELEDISFAREQE
jgi:hypothetical protein